MLTQDCFCTKEKDRKTLKNIFFYQHKKKLGGKTHTYTQNRNLDSSCFLPRKITWAQLADPGQAELIGGAWESFYPWWCPGWKGPCTILTSLKLLPPLLPQPIFPFNGERSCAERYPCPFLRMGSIGLDSVSPGIINHALLCCSLLLNTSSVQYFKYFWWSKPILIFWK